MERTLIYSLVLVFLIPLGFAGCVKKTMTGEKVIFPPVPAATTDTLEKSYLALGDSYTIGAGVNASERYPTQTINMLKEQGIFFSPVTYIAQTGWTTNNLAGAIAISNLKPPYDIVTLLIGVNDQYQRNDTTGYRANFTQLLETSIKLSGNRRSRVIVLSIPDYGVTIFGAGWPNVGKQIDVFNAINRSVTESYEIAYLDITGISRKAAGAPGLILGNGPHFTGAEYALWAAPLALMIGRALKLN